MYQPNRRIFLKSTATSLLGLSFLGCGIKNTTVCFGIVTDTHYADTETRGSRFYRESVRKLKECINSMNSEKVDFIIELGDFKDQSEPPVEGESIKYLQTIEDVFQQFNGPTYHVLGNHDMDSVSKRQFLTNVTNTNIPNDQSYYSFDSGNVHFIVLDANFRSDGCEYDHGNFDWTDANIPPTELEWLRHELSSAQKSIVVFCHQLLDGEGDYFVKNAKEVRKLLTKSGKVLAVFQGHEHAGSYAFLDGIHYYTLKAVVEGSGAENNSYAIVKVRSDHKVIVNGYRKATSRTLE